MSYSYCVEIYQHNLPLWHYTKELLQNKFKNFQKSPALSTATLKSYSVIDSSNGVLGMSFTPPPLEKVIAFCTTEMNFVLHSKQNKNKDRIKLS